MKEQILNYLKIKIEEAREFKQDLSIHGENSIELSKRIRVGTLERVYDYIESEKGDINYRKLIDVFCFQMILTSNSGALHLLSDCESFTKGNKKEEKTLTLEGLIPDGKPGRG